MHVSSVLPSTPLVDVPSGAPSDSTNGDRTPACWFVKMRMILIVVVVDTTVDAVVDGVLLQSLCSSSALLLIVLLLLL